MYDRPRHRVPHSSGFDDGASQLHINALLTLVIILFLKFPSQVATTVVDLAGSWDHFTLPGGPRRYTDHS